MPDGEMSWTRSRARLSGHDCDTFILLFMFPPGVSEGRPYAGRSQHAYLPDNEEGRQLLALFQLAFRRRVLFGLSQSLTTGQFAPTFTIHLKTSTCGGPASHGYPDPNYFQSAQQELREMGVELSEALATQTAEQEPLRPHFPARACLLCIPFCCSFTILPLLCMSYISFFPRGRLMLLTLVTFIAAFGFPIRTGTAAFIAWLLVLMLNEVNNYGAAISWLFFVSVGFFVSYFIRWARPPCLRRCNYLTFSKQIGFMLRKGVIRNGVLLIMTACLRPPFETVQLVFLLLASLSTLTSLVFELAARQVRQVNPRGSAAEEPLLTALGHIPTVQEAIDAAAAVTCPQSSEIEVQRQFEPIDDSDWIRFSSCPSVRGRADVATLHSVTSKALNETNRRSAVAAVRQIFENELHFREDYHVFYHSYSSSCLLYELHAVLATLLNGYPRFGPPVIRLLRQPFQSVPSVRELIALRASDENDHSKTFRSVAVSAFCSWFATGGYGKSVLPAHFLQGFVWGMGVDMGDMTSLLEDVLKESGLCEEAVLKDVVIKLLDLGEKYGLSMGPYEDRRGRWTRRKKSSKLGHVLQIFIHSSVVDAVVYGAVPLGQRSQGGTPASEWLARQCPLDGQARLLVHPDLFLDQTSGLVKVFTHCGSPSFGRAEREQMLSEIESIIAPHITP